MACMRMNRLKNKLVLFDIDGTLLDTDGAGREAFIRGLAQVTGERDELTYVSFAGNTDRNVLAQVMAVRQLCLSEAEIRRVFACIAGELRQLLSASPAREIAGARNFLERLDAAGFVLGLVTGNIRECAFVKLASVQLDRFFGFGGFGDEHAERTRIARSALAEAAAAGCLPEETAVCLVGDTPFDVAAGQALGCPVLGIAAGKYPVEDLRQSGASIVADDFTDGDRLLKWLAATLG